MAGGQKHKSKAGKTVKSVAAPRRFRPVRWLMRWTLRGVSVLFLLVVLVALVFRFLNPPTTYYMFSESRRLGGIDHQWVGADDIAPAMLRSVVAAEDANYCNHWGFDVAALRAAIADGGTRGASTISQQVVKNVFLWHGRSYSRKALEAFITPVLEGVWTKRRILEVYLNVAEFDEGVFGIEAAARHYFGVGPEALSPVQAARLAAVLPSPKTRSASRPSAAVRRRAASILDGAATIRRDGRAHCFESD